MSLDVSLVAIIPSEVFCSNITHNLTKMADAAGIYEALWRPEELEIKYARDLIPILEEGLKKLTDSPEEYKKFNPSNGWGTYESLLGFVTKYLKACKEYPKSKVYVSR